jgi:RNA polymerase sigma-70 factor (ECF subfamily)
MMCRTGTTHREADREGTVTDERTDSELLLASKVEPSAFVELYRRHADDVLRYFARRTLDPEAAAELTAETFAEAFASRGSYRDTGANGVGWIYGIAKHQMSRFFRSGRIDREARAKIGIPVRELDPEDYERIEDLIDFEPIRQALIEALGGLPADQRDALRLRIVDGLSYGVVAERLQCADTAARQRVSRGLRRLALVLQERGLTMTEVEA